MQIGDLVRINCPVSPWHGAEATVRLIVGPSSWNMCAVWVGKAGRLLFAESEHLIPLTATLYAPTPSGNVYKPMTDANIASAVARVDAKREVAQAHIGDDRSAPWDAHAEYVFYVLLANEREG
jgi:hypothetical protein